MLGRWAFLIGVVLAVIFGFISAGTWLSWLLVVIGLVVGLVNISDKEVGAFLTAGTVMVLMGYFGGQTLSSVVYLSTIFNNILTLFVPATIVVAVKSVLSLARN
ncbi:MAG TPA: hypothetical protein HA360_00035 [Nanoarchaeota archaeon]|nr:hypothetical protein [Nanoarchaeota archaeon]HIH59243.1 hypothetical protein [Nanoarchaeota archaeon]HII13442.1 hypothetical protein [Nanoarchaeota archaeon]HIJ05531.1 hypothetical protein [Nanoarchaeota archaeon]